MPKLSPGEFVRRRGCDLSEGQNIVATGEKLRAENLALLAAQGLATIEVGGRSARGHCFDRRRTRVAGNSLSNPGNFTKQFDPFARVLEQMERLAVCNRATCG